ncbi:MAG: hypothetical protein ACJ79G_03255 [Myxococcales bacterium]
MRPGALAADVAWFAALAIACVWQLHDLERVLDLARWDEADYLRGGVSLLARGLPDAEWGPLHTVWYFAVSRLQPDRVALYYLSYRLLIVLPTLAIYVAGRRVGGSPIVSVALALLFAGSMAPHVVPRATLLAVLVVLVAIAAAARAASCASFALAAAISLCLASFARPELFVAFAIVSAAFAASLLRKAARSAEGRRRSLFLAGGWAASVAVLVAVFGNPFGNGSNRRFYAFCQHFAVAEVQRAQLDIDPWGQCDVVVHRVFGSATSLGDAARANPDAFFTHLRENASAYPGASLALFESGFGGAPRERWQGWMCLFLVATLAAAAVRMRRSWRRAVRAPETGRTALVALAVLVPTIASAILIHPRDHYLVMQGVLVPLVFVALTGRAARGSSDGPAPAGRPALAIAAAASIAAASPALAPLQANRSQPLLDRVRALRVIDGGSMANPIGILELEGGIDAYLGTGFERVLPDERRPEESFFEFLRRRHVGVVALGPALERHRLFSGDEQFQAFARDPERFGGHRLAVSSLVFTSAGGLPP